MAETKTSVEYNFLSNNCGVKVSNLCYGAMTFGENSGWGLPGQSAELESHAILDRFVELGGNFIDTANVYSKGESERFIGSWFKKNGNRDKIVLATKARFQSDTTDPNGTGLSRRHIMKCVEDSLHRLQTDYIDLYQIHAWDSATPIFETLQALNDLVRCGKVRYVAGSNLTGWQLQKIVDMNRHMGFSQFVSLQQQYSLLVREMELELFDVCNNEGLGVLPWSPLKGGLLAGKISREQQKAQENTRISMAQTNKAADSFLGVSKTLADDKYWNIIDTLKRIAAAKNKTVPQVALRWAIQRKPVTSVIVGAKTIQQLEDNMGAGAGWSLDEEEMLELTTVSSFNVPYPYSFINNTNSDRQHPGVITGYL